MQIFKPLFSSKEKLEWQKVKYGLRYHVPNRPNKREKCAHHTIFMFYPFHNESLLHPNACGIYMEKT